MSICESVDIYLYAGPGDVPAAAAAAYFVGAYFGFQVGTWLAISAILGHD
jgi:hypothetical protein